MDKLNNIKGMLFDLDGVLYVGGTVLEGAIETVNRVRASLPCRFITNTSTLSLQSLQKKLSDLGFQIAAEEIISAPQAALLYLKQQQTPVCRLLLADDVKQDFSELPQADTQAKFILVGDIGDRWSYGLLNELFHDLMQGAQLITIHKNRYWQTEQGLQMDIGGFIHALEYATGTKAMIIGKPSSDFFNIALAELGLSAGEVAIIGDDIDADVGGGQQAGLKGILVKTGKYREAYVSQSDITPDRVIDSIQQLPELLGLS